MPLYLRSFIAALVFTLATQAGAQQVLALAKGERYVLVPNGTKRSTDGAGGAEIRLADQRRIVFSPAGRIEIRDANDGVIDHGIFQRWQGLSAGEIEVLLQQEGTRDRPGASPIRRQLRSATGLQALVYK